MTDADAQIVSKAKLLALVEASKSAEEALQERCSCDFYAPPDVTCECCRGALALRAAVADIEGL